MIKVPHLEQHSVYFVTLKVVQWTDIFIRMEYRDEIAKNLNHCIEHKGLRIFSFCLMTNHLHMIATRDSGLLSELLRDFKSYTGKSIMRLIQENPKESRKAWIEDRLGFLARQTTDKRSYQFWDENNYPEVILSDGFYLQKERYIHQNPVVAGFVARPEDWVHSSACPECPVRIERIGDLVGGSL